MDKTVSPSHFRSHCSFSAARFSAVCLHLALLCGESVCQRQHYIPTYFLHRFEGSRRSRFSRSSVIDKAALPSPPPISDTTTRTPIAVCDSTLSVGVVQTHTTSGGCTASPPCLRPCRCRCRACNVDTRSRATQSTPSSRPNCKIGRASCRERVF